MTAARSPELHREPAQALESARSERRAGHDLLRARVVFRDRAAVDVLDLALRFVTVHHRNYAKVSAVVLVPCALASLAVASAWDWAAAWAVAIPLALLAQTPFTLLASRLVFEPELTVRSVLVATLRALPRVFLMRALWAALVGVAALLLVVPALWALSSFHFTSEVLLLERATVTQAFGRSQRVAAASIGESLLAACLGGIVTLTAMALADIGGRALVSDLLQFRPPAAVWDEGGSTLAVLGLFAVIPFAATARFFGYLNVRTRVEGWDIQTRFAGLAARAKLSERGL